MKRYISMFLIIILCFLLQTTLFQNLKIANVAPNLLIILISSYGFMYGRKFGMISGIMCGILSDFIYNDIIGIYILIYVLAGYINGSAHKLYFKDDMSIPVFAVAVSDFFVNILFYTFNFLLRGRLNILVYMKNIILPELVYTVIIGVIIYKILNKLEDKMYPPVEVPLDSGNNTVQEEI